jgi:hypothetical protein
MRAVLAPAINSYIRSSHFKWLNSIGEKAAFLTEAAFSYYRAIPYHGKRSLNALARKYKSRLKATGSIL